MEIWLSWQNNKERLRLPVLPPNFEVTVGNLNTRVNINEIGNINLIGKSDLKEITIERFFPAQEYYFVEYTGFPKPYDCVDMIEGWRMSGKPIRLIITETPINLALAIDNFSYGERDGTGDVYYNLELSEYVFTETKTVAKQREYTVETKRPTTKEVPKTYTVKSGDSLWAISKKLTGNGNNWRTIYNKNKSVIGSNPNLIYPGQKLVI